MMTIKKGARTAASAILALAMVLATTPFALAADGAGTVSVEFTINDAPRTDLYYTYEIDEGDTVYDVLENHFADDEIHWTTDGSYLTSLLGYASEPYTATAGSFVYDETTGLDVYVGGDSLITGYNQNSDVAACGGIYASLESWGMAGYYFTGDMQHMVYIGSDWTYQVDYAADGYGNPVYPPNSTSLDDDQYMYTMDECVLSDGDVVYLYYGQDYLIFQ